MIEVVLLGGLITIGPGVRVAETPFGTLPRVMWSQVALAVWASVGAAIRAMRINAPSVLAVSRRIVPDIVGASASCRRARRLGGHVRAWRGAS